MIVKKTEGIFCMSTKKQVLQMLEVNKNVPYSGQTIADQLGISRTSVWKAIRALREEGYQIESSTNSGYRLSSFSDVLNSESISQDLEEPLSIMIYEQVDSTNAEAKRKLDEIKEGDFLILADEQTSGRGRLGRSFHSPTKTGLYMSLVLQEIPQSVDPTLVTTAAAVAVCQAIEELTDVKPQIKWVNDIFVNGQKICGILTEGNLSLETQTIQSIILGIGVNITLDKENIPVELIKKIGGLLEGQETQVSRNQLASAIINRYYQIYEKIETREFLKEYRKRCFVLGKEITFTKNKEKYSGIAEAVDDQGGLVVRLNSNQKMVLSYGEISIRMKEGNR